MTGHRIGVLICGPWCLGLAALVLYLGPINDDNLIRSLVLAMLGVWIIGRWR